ncbi:hydrogenase nickel incorporation protein HypB [Rubripirellula reticaptiva]|uniref:Hydrogenase isoenzymes nickel incorporation protein HypB n=1 Tax=Rubripirellula reticaptiva TaxID=2528013 RepID=A0A5C6EAF9_9BACT|nr:hydrogenase nickel incorporation protein HypB [Rubripirellula reticaptiva]TWU46703.1 Hydrogenase isoenzymes nickel incorporation protein HypB [Rubripirellula reticaptiva]
MPNRTIVVQRDIQAERREAAAKLRDHFTRQGTLVVNLVSSPGAGKTSLLEATCRHWGDQWNVAVLVGDLATDRDAERLRPYVPVQQLTTGGACHLELSLVEHGLAKLPQQKFDFLFIENIGNLVCPASHDLAEHLRVVLLSTTEGDDKPGKYPKMFRTSDVMVVTKTDLLPYVPFCVGRVADDARLIRDDIQVLELSSLQNVGVDIWCKLLESERAKLVGEGGTP